MNELVQSKIKCYIIAGSNGAGKTTFAENFLKLPSEEMAVKRVQLRVAQGGHNVPKNVISIWSMSGLFLTIQEIYHRF